MSALRNGAVEIRIQPPKRRVQLPDQEDRTRTIESTDDQDRDHGGVEGRIEATRDENNRNGFDSALRARATVEIQ